MDKNYNGRNPKLIITVIAVFIIITLIVIVSIQRSAEGEKAPDFEIKDIDGNNIRLSDYEGKVVILDLMATWCPPCIEEMGHLKEIYNEFDSSDVLIMSIDLDTTETNEELRRFKDDYGDDWIFARDTDGVGDKYNVDSIPTIVIIDKNGEIAYQNVGLTSSSDLLNEIYKLL